MHGVQELPQLLVLVLLRHWLPQRWCPLAQVAALQKPPVHAALVTFEPSGQGEQDVPQLCTLVSDAHTSPQR